MDKHAASEDIAYPSTMAFLVVHAACVAALLSGVTWASIGIAVGLYVLRMFAITAGYHRYFSHRSFKTSRVFQFLLAVLAQTSAQKGILWWAAHHRGHHKHSDTASDPHSPITSGFIYAHLGWIFVPRNNAIDYQAIRDLSGFPELRWLDRHPLWPAILLSIICWLVDGWPGLFVGFCWSTVAVWHATFSINSLAHLSGRRRYVTGDQSRNNWWLALLTMGEGWHNNHHAYQASARQGFRWWEYDPTFYVLRMLSWVGIVWDLHLPTRSLIRGEQRLGRQVIDKAAAQLAASFPINALASQAHEVLADKHAWSELRTRILSARMQAEAFWAEIDFSSLPTLEDVRLRARRRLAQTVSLDEIAVRARQLLLELVFARLLDQTEAEAG